MEASLHEESPRVLIVDDEKVIREILSDFLTMEGYVVRTVENGESALQELERRNYNLVISDLKMPGMGGLQVLDLILDAMLVEAGADVASLLLKDPGTGLFVERTQRHGPNVTAGFAGAVNVIEVLDHYRVDKPILAHGLRALKFFEEPPKDRR